MFPQMNRFFISILFPFLHIILLSCVSEPCYSPNLLFLEERLEVNPDSVLTIIEAIDPTHLPAQDRALHGLLLTRARHKCYIDETNDSLINSSVEFFNRKSDHRHLLKALYLKGYIDYNNSDYSSAILTLIKAKESAEKQNDFEYLARISQRFSCIYALFYNTPKSISYNDDAIHFFKMANMDDEAICATIEKSILLFNNGEYSRSEIFLDSIISQIDFSSAKLKAYALYNLAKAQLQQHKYNLAEQTILKKDSIYNYYIDYVEEQLIKFGILLAKKDTYGAKQIIDSICHKFPDRASSVSIYEAKYELSWTNGDIISAIAYADSVTELQHNQIRIAMSQTSNNVNADYYIEKSSYEQVMRKRSELISLFLIIALILLSVLTILYIRNARSKLKLKRSLIDNKMREIDYLTSVISIKETDLAKLTESVNEKNQMLSSLENTVKNLSGNNETIDYLFNKQFVILNKLCADYFAKKDSDSLKLTIYKEVEKEITILRSPKNFLTLETSLNLYRYNIIQKLDTDFPHLKPIDRKFLILSFARLSSKAICLTLDLTTSNYYNKSQRLRARIDASESPNKELFMRFLR